MAKLVYDFSEGGREMKDLLGGKGANLAEMTVLGLPVPPGFTITTEACRVYLASVDVPTGLAAEVDGHLDALEERMGKRLGDAADPLLVNVRSGAAASMPGMMEPSSTSASTTRACWGWPSSRAASARRRPARRLFLALRTGLTGLPRAPAKLIGPLHDHG